MKLDELIEKGKKFNLELKNLSKKQKRNLMQDLYHNNDSCLCHLVFGFEALWGIQSDEDEIVEEFEYYRKYDFYRKGPKAKANMRRCPICDMLYSDAPLMA